MTVAVHIDRASPVPLYYQVSTQLEAAITTGKLETGALLGNEIELARTWRVSRPTVRRAIGELVDSGLLVRRRGVGTQVVTNTVRRPFALTSLHDDLVASGRTSTCEVLDLAVVPAPVEFAEPLGVSEGDAALFIKRCRLADGVPLAVMCNWLTAELADEITASRLRDEGLYSILRTLGVTPHSASQRVGARLATSAEANLLDIATGAPLMTMHRVMRDDAGRVVEVAETIYDAAQYSLEMSVMER